MSPSAPTPRGSGAREALADAALLAVDAALTAGAALRVTRFATTDVLGGWALSDPLHRWASRHEPGQPFGYLAPPPTPSATPPPRARHATDWSPPSTARSASAPRPPSSSASAWP